MDDGFSSKLSDIIAASVLAPPLRRCLYIEDSYANLLLVDMLIGRRGDLTLLTANTGPLGVQMARDHLPDIIIMDIVLPGFSGLEAMKILRTDPTTAHIPITALSSSAFSRDIAEGLREGFFRYLTKPFRLDEFNATIDVMLRHAGDVCHTR